jgi:hypothetical protein
LNLVKHSARLAASLFQPAARSIQGWGRHPASDHVGRATDLPRALRIDDTIRLDQNHNNIGGMVLEARASAWRVER